MLRRLTHLLASLSLLALTSTAQSATIPFGVQNNVSDATVASWGFTECWTSTYGTSGHDIASLLAGCSGTHLMMAGREVGTTSWAVLAAADFASVTTEIGQSNATTRANGVEWYFSDSYSWGFAAGGDTVNRISCDINSTNVEQRLCWHTGGGSVTGGWSVGAARGLNRNNDWERSLFVANVGATSVSEPAAIALLALGLVGAGAFRTRT